MGPVERWVRRQLNPWSTAVARRWYGGWRDPASSDRFPHPPRPDRSSGIVTIKLVASPAGWEVPVGQRPGWSWLPPGGAMAGIRRMPLWVRLWYMAPLIDRFAYEWMWWHGAWYVYAGPAQPDLPPDPGEGPDGEGPDGGVRERRRPSGPLPVADVRAKSSAEVKMPGIEVERPKDVTLDFKTR